MFDNVTDGLQEICNGIQETDFQDLRKHCDDEQKALIKEADRGKIAIGGEYGKQREKVNFALFH